MAEAAIANAIDRLLKARGAWSANVHNAGYSRNGLPDRIAIYRGRGLAIEIKQPGGTLSRLQRYELSRAARAGAHAIVAYSVADVRTVLDQIDQEAAA